jgi:hypothetical protein
VRSDDLLLNCSRTSDAINMKHPLISPWQTAYGEDAETYPVLEVSNEKNS